MNQFPTTPRADAIVAVQWPGVRGSGAESWACSDFEQQLQQVIDPASALETIHWGRNYLYSANWPRSGGAPAGASPRETPTVVVKQFRNDSFKAQWRRRRRGSKAELSFRMALRLQELGIATPAPVAFLDSEPIDGPSWFISAQVAGTLEARYLIRAIDAGTVHIDYPEIDAEGFFRAFGRLAAVLHDGRVWHRDLTSGNVLIDVGRLARDREAALYVLDLNRARSGRELSSMQRMRDLSRMPAPTAAVRRAMLAGYREVSGRRLTLWAGVYELLRRSFLFKNRSKKGVRGFGRRLRDVFLPRRRPHAHIPPAEEGAGARDKIVWDALSDQPHQHASKGEKMLVRLRDLPEHVLSLTSLVLHSPKVRRRYVELRDGLYSSPVPFEGLGVGLRPGVPAQTLRAVRELGVEHVLLRLHPWQESHDEEMALAEQLRADGHRLVFALPQNRDLVRDPDLWQRRVAELGRRFGPLAEAFQIGQAPNRSKWGIWRPSEYVDLYRRAAGELRETSPHAMLVGPAVIDFEFHATATYLNARRDGLEFDAVSSLLYVDRRGAPENEQLGLDLVGKAVLLRALTETSRNASGGGSPQSWVTEVNWPLWQGPHSPAGRDVAVNEELQADYLVRYYVLALAGGMVERVYWWQLVSKGYGLIDPVGEDLLRRPSFHALRQLAAELRGSRAAGPVGTAGENDRLFRFVWPDGRQTLVGWTLDGKERSVAVPGRVLGAVGRNGDELAPEQALKLSSKPRYLRLAAEAPLMQEEPARDEPELNGR